MAREAANYTPWHVALYYKLHPFEIEDHVVELYARAPKQILAVRLARMIWIKHSKCSPQSGFLESDLYPALDDRADVTCLDDQDYMEQWKAAQGYKRYWAGEEANPLAFAYFPNGEIIAKQQQ